MRNSSQNPTNHTAEGSDFLIAKKIRTNIPNIPFKKIAEDILGKNFDLSLVLCADKLATRINREHRNKTYSPNILSFPLSKDSGEIFLNVRKAEREARTQGIPAKTRMTFLFIHGCLHLAGLDHGKTMESREKAIMKKHGLSTDPYASN